MQKYEIPQWEENLSSKSTGEMASLYRAGIILISCHMTGPFSSLQGSMSYIFLALAGLEGGPGSSWHLVPQSASREGICTAIDRALEFHDESAHLDCPRNTDRPREHTACSALLTGNWTCPPADPDVWRCTPSSIACQPVSLGSFSLGSITLPMALLLSVFGVNGKTFGAGWHPDILNSYIADGHGKIEELKVSNPCVWSRHPS